MKVNYNPEKPTFALLLVQAFEKRGRSGNLSRHLVALARSLPWRRTPDGSGERFGLVWFSFEQQQLLRVEVKVNGRF